MQQLVVALLLLAILFTATQSRIISNTCNIDRDGSRCYPVDQPWQADGVCITGELNRRTCIGPRTRLLKLLIVARYRSLNTRSRGGAPIVDMYIRGNGPGLSWDSTIRMNRSGRAVDRWTAEIMYWVDSNGLPCLNSRHCTLNQQSLEFRIYRDTFGNEGMKGPNFYVPLPLSGSISGAATFHRPEVTVNPWFYSNQIRTRSFTFNMSEQILTRRVSVKCNLLYPPSFNENVRRSYPLVIMLGISSYYTPLLEYLFAHESTVDEVVVLMIELPRNDTERRLFTLSPFSSNSELVCKGDSLCHDCQTCWVPTRVDPCEREEFITRSDSCLYKRYREGIGEPFMESVMKELIVRVQEMTANRIEYDPPRKRVTLMGHTDLAVLVTYTAITQPDVVNNVACFSPRFFLPLNINESYQTLSGIFDVIEQQQQKAQFDTGIQALHYSQKYYFDHGENDNFFFPLADAILTTDDVVRNLREKLLVDTFLNILPNEDRLEYIRDKPPDILSRLKYPMVSFFKPKGGPNRDYVRDIKVTEHFIANRLANLVESGPDENIINIITSNNVTTRGNNITKNYRPPIPADTFAFNTSFNEFCTKNNRDIASVPIGVFIGALGVCTLVSVVITVVLMCVRESSRRATEQDEKEEKELLYELSSDDSI